MGKNGQQYVVCRLHEGKVEHCPLELPYATLGSNPDLADFARDHSPHATALQRIQTGLLLTRLSCSLARFTPEDQPMLHLKGAHAVHLTGFLEMEDEEELEEDEGMADATATKVAAGRQANGGGAMEEEDSEDDDSFEEGEVTPDPHPTLNPDPHPTLTPHPCPNPDPSPQPQA